MYKFWVRNRENPDIITHQKLRFTGIECVGVLSIIKGKHTIKSPEII